MDTNIGCWSETHIFWAVGLGIPMFGLWVIGLPLVALTILIKNRNKLDDPVVKGRYLMLYQGLRFKVFYWEFVNTGRKIFLLSTNIFIPKTMPFLRATLGVIILVAVMRLQKLLHPYKSPLINNLEAQEILTSTLTLYGAIIFVQDDQILAYQLVSFLVIVIVNLQFYTLWLYILAIDYEKHIGILTQFLSITQKVMGYKDDPVL
jgi:hypothetical protein